MKAILVLLLLVVALPVSAKLYETPSGVKVDIPEPKNIIWREFSLPSGMKYVAMQLLPIAKAADLSLKEEIQLWIKQFAKKFGVSGNEMLKLAQCESNYQIEAHNPKDPVGGAWGLYQYLEPTFYAFAKESKIPNLDLKNWKSQIELTASAFSKGKYPKHWINCASFIKYGTWDKTKWK